MTHRRNSYICFSLSAVLALVTLLLVWADTAHARDKQKPSDIGTVGNCSITDKFIYPAGKRVSFTVAGNCTVSLVSYEMRNGGALADQVLHNSTTKEFSCPATSLPSSNVFGARSASLPSGPCRGELTVTVPECRWQVDLVRGAPHPAAWYIDHPGDVLAYRFGGSGECQTQSTTTTSTAPSTTSTSVLTPTTSAPENPTVSTGLPSDTASQSTVSSVAAVIGTRSTPTELAESGGGELLAVAGFAVGLIGMGRYSVWRGKRRRARL